MRKIFLGLLSIGMLTTGLSANDKVNEYIDKKIEQYNKMIPIELDKITTVIKVRKSDNSLQLFEVLSIRKIQRDMKRLLDTQDFKILQEQTLNNLNKKEHWNLCTNNEVRSLMEEGLEFNYIYFWSNKTAIGEITVNKESCKKFSNFLQKVKIVNKD